MLLICIIHIATHAMEIVLCLMCERDDEKDNHLIVRH
jgi:hypothetical protein